MNIKKNLILNSSYQLLNIIVPLITSPYLSRVIGAEGIGIYSYYNSIAYYFILFIMLGLNNYGNRTIARVRDNKYHLSENFIEIYFMQFVTGIICISVYIFFVFFFVRDNIIVALLNIIYVLSGLFDINWFFSGLEKFKIIVIRNALIKLGSLIAILSFVKQRDDLEIYVFIIAFSTLISQISVWPFLKREVVWIRPQWRKIKRHIKPNLVLFIPVIAVSLYKIMDKIMIGLLSTKEEVGFYENSERIINIPQALINSLGTVMLPRITNLLAQGKQKKSKQYTRDSMQYAMIMSMGAAFGLIGISTNFATWFFGDEFDECAILIAFLAPTIIFNAWANVIRTQYLIPLNKDKSYIVSVSLGAIVNLIINYMLIGKLGAFGAVIGTIIAEFVVMFVQTLYVYKEIEVIKYIKDNILFLFSGCIMFGVTKLVSFMELNGLIKLVLQIATGAVVYLSVGMLLLALVDRDRAKYIFNSLVNRNEKNRRKN